MDEIKLKTIIGTVDEGFGISISYDNLTGEQIDWLKKNMFQDVEITITKP